MWDCLYNTGKDEVPTDQTINTRNLSLIILTANIGTLLFGYEVGATSFTIMSMLDYADRDDDSINFYYRFVVDNDLMLVLPI